MKRIFLMLAIIAATRCIAGEPVAPEQTQSLSGILRDQLKSEFRYYLQLDGMTENVNVTGDALKDFKAGDRVFVKGIIKSKLCNPQPDGTPQQQPIHWVIFMEVQQAELISSPFGLKDN